MGMVDRLLEDRYTWVAGLSSLVAKARKAMINVAVPHPPGKLGLTSRSSNSNQPCLGPVGHLGAKS
jgi:hypothetical protein